MRRGEELARGTAQAGSTTLPRLPLCSPLLRSRKAPIAASPSLGVTACSLQSRGSLLFSSPSGSEKLNAVIDGAERGKEREGTKGEGELVICHSH